MFIKILVTKWKPHSEHCYTRTTLSFLGVKFTQKICRLKSTIFLDAGLEGRELKVEQRIDF